MMKKKIGMLIVFIGCMLLCSCGDSDQIQSHIEDQNIPKHNVEIEVNCLENLILSKYDVNVLVDDEKIGTVDHGKKETFSIKIAEGEHNLSFQEENNSAVDGNVKIDITQDMKFVYELSCTSSQIDIKVVAQDNKKVKEDPKEQTNKTETNQKNIKEDMLLQVPFGSSTSYLEEYSDVIAELQQAGFVNIQTEVIYDLGSGIVDSLKKDKVESISIAGKTNFKNNERFEKNTEIVIKYHDLEDNNPNIQYVAYNVSQLLKDLENNALKAKDTHTNEYVQITGNIDSIDASGKYFSLYPTGNGFYLNGIQCKIKTDEQKEKVKTLSTGNTITVKGKITLVGEVLGYSLDLHTIQ